MSNETQKEQRFENMVTVLIASVAIWVAITAYFQNYASNLSDQARRRAQQYAIDSTKSEVSGVIQFSYDWQGAFQTWKELDWQITAAIQNGDKEAEERYRKLQEKIEPLSPIFGAEYFDRFYSYPDSYKYESDLYLVESTRLSETYLAESELGNFTDNVADSLIVQLTLLTVSLSLYGLSMALRGKIRWLFVAVGSGIVVVCVAWLGWSLIQLTIRPEVNHQAIQSFAEGIGLVHQARDEAAIEKFSLAIQENPRYAKAYYERGLSYYVLGDLTTAVSEIERARIEGLDDISLNWNLGWLYYLTGQYEKGLEANERVLSIRPDVLGVRMNNAITYLSMGDFENSQVQYDLLIEEALRQVNEARSKNAEPSASLWYYMDAGALDLQNLIYEIDQTPKAWAETPSADQLRGDKASIREFAYQQMKRLKETTVALEFTGGLPGGQSNFQVEPFIFGSVTVADDSGLVTSFEPAANAVIPYGEDSFTVKFTYTGAPPKQIIWKVYINGYEDQVLRSISTEDISSGDTWYRSFGYYYTNIFILTPGEYTVEMYADNTFVQSGSFTVKE